MLVSTYTNGTDDAYTYAYDVNGNITSITKGSQSFTYVYDAANQLIRENLYYGSGNTNNATYTYTYDQWGNILKKSRYAYTLSDLPATAQSEISYGYNSRGWCDLLTSYNGQTITYDSMGNPTSYRGKTLSWEGKQLLSVSQSYNGTPLYEYSFSYNEDGLRTQKEISIYGMASATTNYYYNGSVLIGMSSPDAMQRFSYDASGKVVSVDFSTDDGSTYTTYYYLRNAQGDIVKLIDGSGSTVVEYVYDSWGKVLSTTGTLAYTVGFEQPFRYRGYVYDRETQWYYLQSRYYDPTTGRFISADVLLSTGQGVLGHNAFAYCLNNPVKNSDLSGKQCICLTNDCKVVAKKLRTKAPKVVGSNNGRRSLPTDGEPNSNDTLYNPDGTPKQKRWYGPDGKPERDRDYNHNGKGKYPHDHEWVDGNRNEEHLDPSPDYEYNISPLLGVGIIFAGIVGIGLVAADDLTGAGVADDFLIAPILGFIGSGFTALFGW